MGITHTLGATKKVGADPDLFLENVIALSEGGYAVFSLSGRDGSGNSEHIQFFYNDLTAYTSVIQANQHTYLWQQFGNIAELADGNVIATWGSPYPINGSGEELVTTFDTLGNRLTDEAVVNQTVLGNQGEGYVTALSDGTAFVVWVSDSQDAGGLSVWGRHINGSGTSIGNEFIINSSSPSNQFQPTACQMSNGNIVVAWQSEIAYSGSPFNPSRYTQASDVRFCITRPDGTVLQTETLVYPEQLALSGKQKEPHVAATPGGGFVVVWAETTYEPYAEARILARAFDSDGVATSGAVDVTSFTLGSVSLAYTGGVDDIRHILDFDVFVTSQGAVATTWCQYNPASGHYDVLLKVFKGNLSNSSEDIVIASSAEGDMLRPRVIESPSGELIVFYTEKDSGIYSCSVSFEFSNSPPVVSGDLTVAAAENIAAGTTLATASAVDPDAGATLTYSIISGNPAGLFTIDSSTGVITLAAGMNLNYEFQNQHVIAIGISDGDMSSTQFVTINVVNVNGDVISGTSASNAISGTSGNDDIYGLAGNDFLAGKGGNDLIDGGAGIDTAVYTSATSSIAVDLRLVGPQDTGGAGWDILVSIENVTGGAGNDTLIGSASANVINGGNGNDSLNGVTGIDTLVGGLGNDIYVTDGGDTITEAASAGTDTVQSSVTYTLGTNIENLTLTGSAAINGTGNTLNNSLIGNSANNTLNGGTGTDTLSGGAGDDTYVTDGGDMITEGVGAGTDTVQSSVTLTLFANVENLTLTGTSAINGTGNDLANVLLGNTGANTLIGGAGADTLIGGNGKDLLTGGLDSDTFVFRTMTESGTANAAIDVISDFVQGQDKIDLSQIDAFSGGTANDGFVWNGTAAFSSATSGEVRYQRFDNTGTTNDYTVVYLDNDGDTGIESTIRLTGLYTLTASDFIL